MRIYVIAKYKTQKRLVEAVTKRNALVTNQCVAKRKAEWKRGRVNDIIYFRVSNMFSRVLKQFKEGQESGSLQFNLKMRAVGRGYLLVFKDSLKNSFIAYIFLHLYKIVDRVKRVNMYIAMYFFD